MKKDFNYYSELIRMDVKKFNQLPDTTWEVSYKKLPNIIGKGFGVSEAERDLETKVAEWIEYAVENGIVAINKNRGEALPVSVRPCPFCGGKNIGVAIVGCE